MRVLFDDATAQCVDEFWHHVYVAGSRAALELAAGTTSSLTGIAIPAAATGLQAPPSSAAQQQRCAPGVGLAMCSKALAWRSGRCALCCSGPGGGSPLAEGGTQTGQGQRLVGFELYS